MDSWWSLASEDQAVDRVHRIGQERPVTVTKFIARNTIEERILMVSKLPLLPLSLLLFRVSISFPVGWDGRAGIVFSFPWTRVYFLLHLHILLSLSSFPFHRTRDQRDHARDIGSYLRIDCIWPSRCICRIYRFRCRLDPKSEKCYSECGSARWKSWRWQQRGLGELQDNVWDGLKRQGRLSFCGMINVITNGQFRQALAVYWRGTRRWYIWW